MTLKIEISQFYDESESKQCKWDIFKSDTTSFFIKKY